MEKRVFIIDNQSDFIQYLKYIQDKSLDGCSFNIHCKPVKGKDGGVKGEFVIRTFIEDGWTNIPLKRSEK